MTGWLGLTDAPLFVSRIRLEKRRRLPRAAGHWALDSGGFTELNRAGCWSITPQEYVKQVRQWSQEIGRMEWAASMDWMCEPCVLAKTGLTVQEHQRRTVENYLELTALAPSAPWAPVLQGWTEADYLHCVDLYAASGVDLTALPVVGLGSICRRQGTAEAERIIASLSRLGIRLHGFGFKLQGVRRSADLLGSCDSLAWSFNARKNAGPCPYGGGHLSCNSCLPFALAWRDKLLQSIRQESLFHGVA